MLEEFPAINRREFDIVLTGIPRSGTTLVCFLLNKLPQTIALHEPIAIGKLSKISDPDALCNEIIKFFQLTRKSVLKNGTAISKHINGFIPDNPAEELPKISNPIFSRRLLKRIIFRQNFKNGLRKFLVRRGRVKIEKLLDEDFLLCIKHPGSFTALLKNLCTRFRCFAVIRNPLAVLASWNSLEMNTRNGHAPQAERLDRQLGDRLTRINSRFDRQLYLLSWFFEKYQSFLQPENILCYEDIVCSKGKCLEVITHRASELEVNLENKNRNVLYDRNLMQNLGKMLIKSDTFYKMFYSREDIELLMKEICT